MSTVARGSTHGQKIRLTETKESYVSGSRKSGTDVVKEA